MIAFLRGRVIERHPDRIVVDVQGVGYEVHVPLSTYYVLGDEGSEVGLRVHTHIREDTLQLYGFLSSLEQEMFERLIAISGIGPRLALGLLSGIHAGELVGAVQRADVARLTRVPGIGRKTAERIVLELKDRLASVAAPATVAGAESPLDRLRVDLISALLNLGYHRPLAERAVDSALKSRPDLSFEVALKSALRELMR